MTAARPSRARRSRMASATARAAARPIMGRLGKTSDAQAAAGEDPRARALRGAPPPQLVRGPARGSAAAPPPAPRSPGASASPTRRRPSESPPAAVSQSRTRAAGKSPRPGRTGGHGIFPSGGRRASLRWTWRRKGPSAAAPASGSSPNSEKALAGSHTAPSPSLPASSRRERVAAAVAKSPCVSSQTSTPVPRRRSRRSAEGLDDPAPRRGEVGARLHAVAEDADARAPPGAPRRSAVRSASSTASASRGGVGAVEEGARVDAGDGEAGVGEAGERLPEAGARELGPRPERVVALDEAQLDAVVAEPARRRRGCGRAARTGSRASRRRA